MKVSWQPSSSLKKCLIDEFEQGITCDIVDLVSPSYGSTAHTPVVSQQSHTHDEPLPSKRKKQSIFAAPPNNGYILNKLLMHTHSLSFVALYRIILTTVILYLVTQRKIRVIVLTIEVQVAIQRCTFYYQLVIISEIIVFISMYL